MKENSRNTMRQTVISSVAEAPEMMLPREKQQEVHETSRDYRNPRRPFPLGAVNAVGRLMENAGLRRTLNADELVRSAARDAGYPGFSGVTDDYREGLEVLVESIEREANLNPLGRMITRGRLKGVLRARFRAEKMMEEHPEILLKPLSPPVVITGLQRTGTTLLHRLMASDRRFRSLSTWEVLDPVPPPPGKADPRVKSARLAERGAAWMAPDFFAVHPIDHRAPEEDVLLLDNTFRSTVAEAILRVPSYASWLENADSTPAYHFMRKLLLLLQSVDNRPFWILKTPHHLEYLDVLLKVFPETKVIQSHRDPVKTTGSFLSMVAHGYGMFSDSPDPVEIGRHWIRKCHRMVERGMAFRQSMDAQTESRTFLDISYDSLVADPITVLEEIYRFVGVDFDNNTEREARVYLGSHGRHRFGKHVYRLSDFGVSADEIQKGFTRYSQTYNIRPEI